MERIEKLAAPANYTVLDVSMVDMLQTIDNKNGPASSDAS